MYEHLKDLLVTLMGLSRDSLHANLGILIFLAAGVVFRKPLGHWIPIAAVVLLELVNEMFDRARDITYLGYWDWAESVHDMLNTTLLPAIIFLMIRYGIVFKRA